MPADNNAEHTVGLTCNRPLPGQLASASKPAVGLMNGLFVLRNGTWRSVLVLGSAVRAYLQNKTPVLPPFSYSWARSGGRHSNHSVARKRSGGG